MSSSSSEDDLPRISVRVGRVDAAPIREEKIAPKPVDASAQDRTKRKRQEALVKCRGWEEERGKNATLQQKLQGGD